MQTILQIEESQFRLAGKHTDKLLSFLKDCEDLVADNVLTIRTNLEFDLNDVVVQAFNHQLKILRMQKTLMIQIKLD